MKRKNRKKEKKICILSYGICNELKEWCIINDWTFWEDFVYLQDERFIACTCNTMIYLKLLTKKPSAVGCFASIFLLHRTGLPGRDWTWATNNSCQCIQDPKWIISIQDSQPATWNLLQVSVYLEKHENYQTNSKTRLYILNKRSNRTNILMVFEPRYCQVECETLHEFHRFAASNNNGTQFKNLAIVNFGCKRQAERMKRSHLNKP